MNYPPRPSNISIPAVVAGNILQNDDTSISAIDSGFDGAIVMRTENKVAMLINSNQKTSINTTSTDAMLSINNNSSTTPTIRLSYQDSFYFDGRVTANGNVLFIPSCDDPVLDPDLITAFKKSFDIADHDGMRLGLRLGGLLVTASATELNYVDVPVGTARPNKALVLNSSNNITGINQLDATLLTGTLLTGPQPNITSLNRINITDQLSIRGEVLDVDPQTLRYLNMLNEGVAYASKAMIMDRNKNFVGINHLTTNTISGTLTVGPQPNITSLSALRSLTNNGPTLLNAAVTITTAADDQLTLRFSDTIFSAFGTTATGDMVLRSVSKRIKIESSHDLHVAGHNGSTTGLVLGSNLVTATANQLNYVNTTPGTASADKALVLDSSRNVSGINQLSASLLVGTLQTASQPMITSVSTLNISNHNGTTGLSLNGTLVTASAVNLNYVNTTPGTAAANKALVLDDSRNISGIQSISATTLRGTVATEEQPNIRLVNVLTILNHNGTTGLRLGSTLVTATGAELNRVAVSEGVADARKALVVDGAKNIIGINSLQSSFLTGVIQTSYQPNIDRVNTLNISTHDGSTIGLSLNGTLVTSTAAQLNRVNGTAGVAEQNKALVLDSSFNIGGINILNANTLGGVLSNPTQPNIRNLTSVNIVNHDGINAGLSLNGVLVKSTANQLNYVDVQQGIAAASKALVLNSSREISNIGSISATDINGTIRTASQPFITRVSTLNIMNHNGSTTGLSLNGTLITATSDQINRLTTDEGTASSNKVLVVDSAKNINGINLLGATSISGTLITSNQPNITSVNTLNIQNHIGSSGLSLAGVLITVSGNQLNRVDTVVGSAVAGKVLIVDNSRNISNINLLSASSLSGVLQTESQPNIRSVSTLDITGHDGGANGLRLNGILVTSTGAQLNYNSVVPGVATSTRALVTNQFNSISGINTLSATKIVSNELSLTGIISNFNTGGIVIKTYSMSDISGRVVDIQLLPTLSFSNFQPADMPNDYSCEIIGYVRPQFSETYTFYITCNDRVRLWINGELILHSWAKNVGTRISQTAFLNAEQWVPVYIQYQVDTGSSPFFRVEWASNSTNRGAIASSRLAWDNNPPPVSNKHSTQNSLTIYNTSTPSANFAKLIVDTGGDLIIDASGNDITLGSSDSLNIPSHNGTNRGLYLGGVLVQPSAYELNYLKVSPGVVSASQALVVDASKSIAGLNSITATTLACDNLSTNAFTINNLSLSGPLNNYNTGALLIRQFTGPDVNGRIVSVSTISDINLNNYDPRELNTNFSLDIIGYILPTFTESYRFFAIANDRVRIWIGNTLIMNVWDSNTGLEYTSDPVLLTAGQWVPIYIQFQNLSGSSSLQVRWASPSLVKSFINNSFMAWDNSFTRPPRTISSADQISLFSSSPGLISVQTGTVAVDGNGVMSLSSRSGVVTIATATSFNIIGHNGTRGLQLAGNLVTATAAELNYLAGVTPGTVSASKAIVLDISRSLTGLTSISSTDLVGTIRTPSQPFITSFGALSSTLNTSSDIIINSSNSIRFAADSTACYIQSGSGTSTNASADLFIGNYGASISASTRKLMIKASGFVGVQTSSPTRALSINGAGATYSMRLINNATDGSESAFCDLGADASSNLRISSNLVIGATQTATISVNTSGIMRISPTGGSLQIGNSTNSVLPLEVGSTAFTLTTSSGYVNSEGSVGTTVPTATSYSMRTSGSIVVNGTVCVVSDERLKTDIEALPYNSCREFIKNSRPVRFKYSNDPLQTRHCGLIAQDVAKTDFVDLVKISPYTGLKESIDSDGYVSPADAAFNVSYEQIVPIIMTAMKESINDTIKLKNQVYSLITEIQLMNAQIKTLEEKLNQR